MLDGNTVLLVVAVALVIALAVVGIFALSKRENGPRPAALVPSAPTPESDPYKEVLEAQTMDLQHASRELRGAGMELLAARMWNRADQRYAQADRLRDDAMSTPTRPDRRPRDEGREDDQGRTRGGWRRGDDAPADTTTPRQTRFYTLSINGTRVPRDRDQVNVAGGYVTLSRIPGENGYAAGTIVTITGHPETLGSEIEWQGGARRDAPYVAIATMDRNRNVRLLITPPAARPVVQDQSTLQVTTPRAQQLLERAREQGITS